MTTPAVIEWSGPFNFNKIEENYGTLRGQKGVYLWIYEGNPKRVVYVGTGTGEDGIFRRLCIEKAELLCGKHYCFKGDSYLDPYEVYLRKDYSEINELVKKGKFYYPESNIKEAEYFSTEDFLDYLNKLLVYTADLSKLFDMVRIDDVSKTLETQIQTFLLASNDIGYYRKWGFQSWLGKVEKLRKNNFEKDFQKLLDTQFKFSLAEINELKNFSTMESFTDIIKSKLEKK